MSSKKKKGKGVGPSSERRKKVCSVNHVPKASGVPEGQPQRFGTWWVVDEGKKVVHQALGVNV